MKERKRKGKVVRKKEPKAGGPISDIFILDDRLSMKMKEDVVARCAFAFFLLLSFLYFCLSSNGRSANKIQSFPDFISWAVPRCSLLLSFVFVPSSHLRDLARYA